MGWFILKHIFSTIFTFLTIGRQSHLEKDLEILPERHQDGVVLRQQLSILQRKLNSPIKPNRVEKMGTRYLISPDLHLCDPGTENTSDRARGGDIFANGCMDGTAATRSCALVPWSKVSDTRPRRQVRGIVFIRCSRPWDQSVEDTISSTESESHQ